MSIRPCAVLLLLTLAIGAATGDGDPAAALGSDLRALATQARLTLPVVDTVRPLSAAGVARALRVAEGRPSLHALALAGPKPRPAVRNRGGAGLPVEPVELTVAANGTLSVRGTPRTAAQVRGLLARSEQAVDSRRPSPVTLRIAARTSLTHALAAVVLVRGVLTPSRGKRGRWSDVRFRVTGTPLHPLDRGLTPLLARLTPPPTGDVVLVLDGQLPWATIERLLMGLADRKVARISVLATDRKGQLGVVPLYLPLDIGAVPIEEPVEDR